MPPKVLGTIHDMGTKFSVVLILKRFLISIRGKRKGKMEPKKQQEKTVDCYRILSIINYVISFIQTTAKQKVLNS